MAHMAEDLEVVLPIVTAPQDGNPVVNLEDPAGPACAAQLTGAASGSDQGAAATVGEELHPGAAVVGGPHSISRGPRADHRRERSLAAGGTGAAQHDQVGRGASRGLVDPEDVQGPAPVEATALTRTRAPDSNSSTK